MIINFNEKIIQIIFNFTETYIKTHNLKLSIQVYTKYEINLATKIFDENSSLTCTIIINQNSINWF